MYDFDALHDAIGQKHHLLPDGIFFDYKPVEKYKVFQQVKISFKKTSRWLKNVADFAKPESVGGRYLVPGLQFRDINLCVVCRIVVKAVLALGRGG